MFIKLQVIEKAEKRPPITLKAKSISDKLSLADLFMLLLPKGLLRPEERVEVLSEALSLYLLYVRKWWGSRLAITGEDGCVTRNTQTALSME